jgi:hypothetical protein
MNISNLTSTFMNGNITGKIFDSFKNRKFFDNSVLNKINTLTELGNQSSAQVNQGFESVTNNTNPNVGNLFSNFE